MTIPSSPLTPAPRPSRTQLGLARGEYLRHLIGNSLFALNTSTETLTLLLTPDAGTARLLAAQAEAGQRLTRILRATPDTVDYRNLPPDLHPRQYAQTVDDLERHLGPHADPRAQQVIALQRTVITSFEEHLVRLRDEH